MGWEAEYSMKHINLGKRYTCIKYYTTCVCKTLHKLFKFFQEAGFNMKLHLFLKFFKMVFHALWKLTII